MQVLNGNLAAGEALASVVHCDIKTDIEDHLVNEIPVIPIENIGIWIDPIGQCFRYFLDD